MFRPAGGRVGGASDLAVAVHQSYPPNTTPARDFEVGVVDTGFAAHKNGPHPWLVNHIVGEDNTEELPATGMLEETHCHGTFVTGLILREAPAAKVRMVKPKDWRDDNTVAEAIESLKEDCRLINLSFVGTEIGRSEPEVVVNALNKLDEETVVVVASGNQGVSDVAYPAGVRTGPGRCKVIAVGAVDETRRAQVGAPPTVAGFSNYGSWVHCYASGVQVLGPYCYYDEEQDPSVRREAQDYRGWALWSGTSFAAATVTGVIARLIMEQGLAPRVAAEKLLEDAKPIPVPHEGGDIEWKPYVRGRASTWGEISPVYS